MKCKEIMCAAAAFVLLTQGVFAESLSDYRFANDYGDYLFFDSSQLNNGTASYNNFTFTENDNYIGLGRLNYKSADRNDWIYMEKSTDNACEITITLVKNPNAYSASSYEYFIAEGSFKSDIFTSDLQISLSDGSRTVRSILECSSGNLSDWTDVKLYADLTEKHAVLSTGGKAISSVNLEKLESLSKISFALTGSRGNMYIDKLRVTGVSKPCAEGESRSDIFGIYEDERAFLKNKYAVCSGIDRLLKNGEFINARHTPFFKNGDVYISAEDFKLLFGKDVSDSDKAENTEGVLYVPAAELAKTSCGKQAAVHAKAEAAVISDEELDLANKDWRCFSERTNSKITLLNSLDFIINYITFERPSAERLASDFKKTGEHPRIMLTSEAVDKMKLLRKTDPIFSELTEKFLSEAESGLAESIAGYNYADNLRMKNEADKCIKRIKNWGLAWNLTGESKYVERAWSDLRSIADFPDYNLATIHDSAEFNAVLAIGYDWFYNGLTDERRAYLENAILKHSLPPLADGYTGRIFAGGDNWSAFKWASNLNAVANTGVILAATAVFDIDVQYCSAVISQALKSLEYTMLMFSPDGGWNEGPGYWSYAMTYLCGSIETLRTAFGSDYSLSGTRGFKSTAEFYCSLSGPCGINNFGDSAAGDSQTTDAFGMLADISQNRFFSDKRAEELLKNKPAPHAEDIIFYKTDGVQSSKTLGSVIVTRGTESFSSGVGCKNDEMYFSTHFGRTSGYHAHNDTGTFVLDMQGERWAEDLGSESYALENFAGYKEWQIYRKRAEGHNCLVINPSPNRYEQKMNLFVPIDKYGFNSENAFVCAELTDIYDGADSVKLGYYIGNKYQSLTAVYEITLSERKEMYWFMHTKADIAIDGNTAILTKNGKSIRIVFETSGADSIEVKKMSAESLFDELKQNGQNKNAAYSKLAVSFGGAGSVMLKVKIAPISISVNTVGSIDDWNLN